MHGAPTIITKLKMKVNKTSGELPGLQHEDGGCLRGGEHSNGPIILPTHQPAV